MSGTTAQAPAMDAAAEVVMAHHAKTFNWANRLMPQAYRRDFAVLYAFCRMTDDVVDEAPDSRQARAAADALLEQLQSRTGRSRPVTAFLELTVRRRIPLEIPQHLIEGVAGDVGRVRVSSVAELQRYGYRVASSVGLMVCHILDVRNRSALAHAIDLGIAMQLTNIARDVIEDYGKDRIYLPSDMIDHAVVARAVQDGEADARNQVYNQIIALLDMAQRYYRSADDGMCYLPRWARWGILTAGRCYEAIGGVIRARGRDYWAGRCYVTSLRKAYLTSQAAAQSRWRRQFTRPDRSAGHDSRLHDALAGLTDANTPQNGHAQTTSGTSPVIHPPQQGAEDR